MPEPAAGNRARNYVGTNLDDGQLKQLMALQIALFDRTGKRPSFSEIMRLALDQLVKAENLTV